MIIDFETNPLNSGNAEMDAAPTMQKRFVQGIDFARPPRSLAWMRPVCCSTEPIVMNSLSLIHI